VDFHENLWIGWPWLKEELVRFGVCLCCPSADILVSVVGLVLLERLRSDLYAAEDVPDTPAP